METRGISWNTFISIYRSVGGWCINITMYTNCMTNYSTYRQCIYLKFYVRQPLNITLQEPRWRPGRVKLILTVRQEHNPRPRHNLDTANLLTMIFCYTSQHKIPFHCRLINASHLIPAHKYRLRQILSDCRGTVLSVANCGRTSPLKVNNTQANGMPCLYSTHHPLSFFYVDR